MGMADELEQLHRLHRDGAMTDAEYEAAKTSLLRRYQGVDERLGQAVKSITADEKTWCMLMHFAQFCGHLVPLAGLVVPIVMWQVKKDQSVAIDAHGRNITNWIISEIIYGIVAGLLCFVFCIGIPLLAILGILSIVFPIIGGLKASNGEIWPYPGAMTFF